MIWFNFNLAAIHYKGEENKLITHGPYNVVRHPLYAILLLTLPALFMVWYQDLIFIAPWILIVISAHILIAVEERGLIETFGEDYRSYQRYVPMLVPYKGVGGARYRQDRDAMLAGEKSKKVDIKERDDANEY